MKKVIINDNNYLLIVNKDNCLDKGYYPNDLCLINPKYSVNNQMLRKKAKDAFERMASEALKENLILKAVSTFRSYEYQDKLYNNYVKERGSDYADMCSAKSGHSEHQTGLAVDISDSSGDYDHFENTKEFSWVKDNAHKYGFILRYPKDKTHVTKYKYEPWHYRYVGKKATKFYINNLTLEEKKI